MLDELDWDGTPIFEQTVDYTKRARTDADGSKRGYTAEAHRSTTAASGRQKVSRPGNHVLYTYFSDPPKKAIVVSVVQGLVPMYEIAIDGKDAKVLAKHNWLSRSETGGTRQGAAGPPRNEIAACRSHQPRQGHPQTRDDR